MIAVSCLPRLKKLTRSSCIFAPDSRRSCQLPRTWRLHSNKTPSQARGCSQPHHNWMLWPYAWSCRQFHEEKQCRPVTRRGQPGAYVLIWFPRGFVKSCYVAGPLSPLQFPTAGPTSTLP